MARTKSTSTRQGNQKRSRETWDERLIQQLIPWRREIAGFFLFILSALALLGFLGLTKSGPLSSITHLLRQLIGWGVFPLSLSMAIAGIYLMLRRLEKPFRVFPGQVVGFELMLLAALSFSHLVVGNGLVGALKGQGGGLIGWALSEPLLELLGPFLTVLLQLVVFSWGLALTLRIGWNDVIDWLNKTSRQLQGWSDELEADIAERRRYQETVVDGQPVESSETEPSLAPRSSHHDELIIIDDSAVEAIPQSGGRDRRLPSYDVLEESAAMTLSTDEIDTKKQVIEQTLMDFGLPALVTEIRRGPAVTQFGVQPGYIERAGPDGQLKQYKVRVGQIAALQKDLALALAVTRLRIEAPVPGRGIVGLEVPNADTNIVRLRPIIESERFFQLKSPLAVALGRDVTGGPVATDLGSLPHLLIAGTTGSGKSVCLNALIACLVFNNMPDQLKLVMIDPKKVELIRFNGLPHLLGKVEVEGDRVIGVLRWLTGEMDRRYEIFAEVGAKHLKDYNRRASRRKGLQKLPYVAVFVDELADLMAMYPADVEQTLCRLAQMARATGIHLVVATQRPSTDVITGLIKANFPARASFAVASSTDSRVILDSVGAEHLLGKGDMLFLPPDASSPLRVQGCFVSDHEIEAIVSHWQSVSMPDELEESAPEAPWEQLIARKAFVSETDDMLEQAIALAQKHDKISASLIQRRLRVGYPRAARLMETLHEMGLIEDPKVGGRTRRTFISENDDPLNEYLSRSNGGEEPEA